MNTSMASGANFPAIALSGNNGYVVWRDDNTSGDEETLYKRSTDGGDTSGGTDL